ncbi:MAG: ABC transporter substrate-binding protein [Eubacteriales bacterium]
MVKVKRCLCFAVAACLMMGIIGFAAGCNKSDVLLVWAHTQELKDIVEEYYFEAYPEKKEKVKVEVYPDDVFQTKLDGVLSTGINAPDVMILQIGFIQKYIEKGSLASLSSDGLGLSAYAEEKCYDYTIDVATGADGKLYGLAWQAIPGGYFYRRSVAEELWGQSDPEFVQSKLSTWDDFMEVAYELKNHGDKRIMSSLNGSLDVFVSQRERPWIENGKMEIQSFVTEYFEHCRALQEGRTGDKAPQGLYVNETSEFTTGWYTDMSNPDIFGFFLPAWGMQYYLKNYAGDTYGDWGLVRGPVSWFSGSSMLSVYEGSKKKDEAKHLIEYLCLNEEFLETYARESGEFVNNKNVVNTIKKDCSEEFLAGQNHYALFDEWAKDVNGDTVGPYDSAIYTLFKDVSIQYALNAEGYRTLDEAVGVFKALIKNSFPTISVV